MFLPFKTGLNEALFKGLAHSPCQEPTQTQLQRGPRRASSASALRWFVWRKLKTPFLQCVMVNVTSVVDSWGQGSRTWGHKGELVGLSLFTQE